MKRIIVAGLVSALSGCATDCVGVLDCDAPGQHQPIATDVSLADLQAHLSGVSVAAGLNGFTPNKNQYVSGSQKAYHKPNDSYVRVVGPNGQVYETNFNIEPVRDEPYTVYVNGIHLSNLSILIDGDAVVFRAEFESVGSEVIVDCVENFICFTGTQHLQYDDLVVTTRFVPDEGANTFRLASYGVDVSANPDLGLLGLIPGIESKIDQKVEARLMALLAENEGALVDAFHEGLRMAYGLPKGSRLGATYVDADSVHSIGSKPCL